MKALFQACMMLFLLTIITGIIYPVSITAVAQLLWNDASNGSLVIEDGTARGSKLFAQSFTQDTYFWPRPSGPSNFGPTSAALRKQIDERRTFLAHAHGCKEADVPVDLLTASGSGIDPHIFLQSAHFQRLRVSKARKLNAEHEAKLRELIHEHSEGRQFGLLGETVVNVFNLNRALDKMVE